MRPRRKPALRLTNSASASMATSDRASVWMAPARGSSPLSPRSLAAKYRLGNEAETYLETTFAYGVLSEDKEPAYFDTRITLAYVAPTSQSNTLRDNLLAARGVRIGAPGLGSAAECHVLGGGALLRPS